eukprot:TRINITY_DN13683_c0_g1_i2.p1 TRINITY_DN13683_c0_g1~~TRINITY_DN13683_c0_g1_i2.p1  ORF type:complete len:163 (-),score=24.46 TRINITY_DN13683_c0_g1_i2:429-917(-)
MYMHRKNSTNQPLSKAKLWLKRTLRCDPSILDEKDSRPPIEQLKDLSNTVQSFDSVFHLGDKIATGSFGTIYEVNHKGTLEPYAVKVINLEGQKDCLLQIINECRVLRCTNYKNLTSCYDIYMNENELYMVLEYCSAGALSELYEGKLFAEMCVLLLPLQAS